MERKQIININNLDVVIEIVNIEEFKNGILYLKIILECLYNSNYIKEHILKINDLLVYDVFKIQFEDLISIYETKKCKEEIDKLLSDDLTEIQEIKTILNSDILTDYKIAKIYQILISLILTRYNSFINKINLIKHFDFNSLFYRKNMQYFNANEVSLYQSVRCKEVKSPLTLIKKELFDKIELENIDYILLNNLLEDIYRNNISTPYLKIDTSEGKKMIVDVYYKIFLHEDEFIKFIKEFNEGSLNLSDYNVEDSNFNQYVDDEYASYLKDKYMLNDINKDSFVYGLFGEFGCIVLKNYYDKHTEHLTNFIELKDNIATEVFMSIVKTYKIDKEHERKVIINLIFK